ncbi:DUF2149 domain-containing protein [Humisphaera borealis]|uniref:DUF2149 domain-containing protein n=1 Tax=Humisphaera borealis TaxID=2807512 RepID=UPI0019CF4EDE|nr:DUF2149 domain-containing protein [Humisphaera borealis]
MFDIWMVFAIAVLIAFVQAGSLRSEASGARAPASSTPTMREKLASETVQVMQMEVSNQKLSGQGERLGTAYRLKSGQVVYVPEPNAR